MAYGFVCWWTSNRDWIQNLGFVFCQRICGYIQSCIDHTLNDVWINIIRLRIWKHFDAYNEYIFQRKNKYTCTFEEFGWGCELRWTKLIKKRLQDRSYLKSLARNAKL